MMRALIILLLPLASLGQADLARKHIKKLSSPEFYGRGYTHNADKLAANYVKDEFQRYGLQSVGDNYYQKFQLNVNTFPNEVEVALGSDTLETGEDYIIDPYSGLAEGVYQLEWIDSSKLKALGFNGLKALALEGNVAFVVDVSLVEDTDERLVWQEVKFRLASIAPVLWRTSDKLTWSVAAQQLFKPILEVRTESLPRGARTVYLNVKPVFKQGYTSQNVMAMLPAKTRCGRRHFKVITAHYDHLGQMGSNTYIPGANDNASGIAMLLSLAKYYAQYPPKKYNVVFIAFGGEEAGLKGSKYYTEHPLFPLKRIDFLLNLDLLGTGSEGITVVNGSLHKKAFNQLVVLNKDLGSVPKVKIRGEAANSDHYYFTKQDVRAFFVYTMGGITAYHDIYDREETLPLTKFNALFELFIRFLDQV